MKFILMLLLSLAATARAQTEFHAYLVTEDLLEGGRVEKMTVASGPYQFAIRPPKNWSRQVDEAGRKILFKSPTGQSAIQYYFSTNSPGPLPPDDELRPWAMAAHPGAGVIQTSVCPNSYQPGIFFDLVRMPSANVIQKFRHAFVAEPQGILEVVSVSYTHLTLPTIYSV